MKHLTWEQKKKRIRTQLTHMQKEGTLVDWVMNKYPRDPKTIKDVNNKFQDALKVIIAEFVAKTGETRCPKCGRAYLEEIHG